MTQEGDAPEGQPAEGVVTLDDIADAMTEKAETPAETDESEEESEEAEVEEAEEEEEAAEEEEAEDDPTVKIKHDGKEVELKLSEALNLAQQGFDYSKKTMAVAEEKKAVEAIKQEVTRAKQRHEQALNESLIRLQTLTQFIEKQIGDPPPVEWAAQDAGYYIAQKEQYEARRGQLHQAYAALQQVESEKARQRQADIEQRAAATEKVLRDTLPGWGDDTLSTLAEYAGKVGLTPDRAESALLEPGFWQIVHKAQAYDAIQARKAEMKPKEKLAKVARPSAQNQTAKATERAKREAAFNKNPSVDTLAELFR